MSKRTIGLMMAALFLLLAAGGIYTAIGIHYQTHFFEHTTINGMDASGLTVEEAEKMIAGEVEHYQLMIQTREEKEEVITGEEIGYRFASRGEIRGFLGRQNAIAWFPAFLGDEISWNMTASVEFDEDLLGQAVDQLACMQEENITHTQDAYVDLRDGTYVVIPEVEGNETDRDQVYEILKQAVLAGTTKVYFADHEELYTKPEILESNEYLHKKADALNRYNNITITYLMGGGITETLDKSVTAGWITLDEELRPTVDREKVSSWVAELAAKYDTIGTWPAFRTTNGEIVYPEARTYGWQLDQTGETEVLYQRLMDAQSGEREPYWLETAITRGENDIGDTYVEIDYTNQHMWYYKSGRLLVDTPVVTGNVSLGQSSPEGIFCIVGKERDAILKGEGYETPVSYWMPFFGGVGIHDADTWRSTYGGTIYQYSGSHGCINTPMDQVSVMYENIVEGTPVICYSSGNYYGYPEREIHQAAPGGAQNGIPQIPEPDDIYYSDPSWQWTDPGTSWGNDGQSWNGDGNVVIIDGGGSGSSDYTYPDEDWADESIYYQNLINAPVDQITVYPDM